MGSVIKLDAQDAMLLENMLLKEQLASINLRGTRDNYQAHLVGKYKIDTSKYQIKLDPAQGAIELVEIATATHDDAGEPQVIT